MCERERESGAERQRETERQSERERGGGRGERKRHNPDHAARHHAFLLVRNSRQKNELYQTNDKQHQDRTVRRQITNKKKVPGITFKKKLYQAKDRQHPDRTARRHALPRFDIPEGGRE